MNSKNGSSSDAPLGSTILSMLIGVANQNPQTTAKAQERFVRYYGQPLTRYLSRSLAVHADEADDLLHDFLLVKLIDTHGRPNLAQQFLTRREADPDLRFSSYMLRSLKNFVVDQHRRSGPRTIEIESLEGFEPSDEIDPLEAMEFDRDWAHNLVEQALVRFEEECRTIRGKADLWWLFERRIIRPLRNRERQPRYDELQADLPQLTPKQASHRLRKALQRFNSILKELIVGYLPASEQIDRHAFEIELADLRRALALPITRGALDRFNTDTVTESNSNHLLMQNDSATVDQLWDENEYSAIWSHLMTIPLDRLLSEWDSPLELRFSEVGLWEGVALQTLPDLWRHPKPPLELLQTIRRQAKRSGKGEETSDSATELPTRINFVLYVSSIATAWLRHRTTTTRESVATCQQWARIALDYPWIDRSTRELISCWLLSLQESTAN